jgi:hypothetical protein
VSVRKTISATEIGLVRPFMGKRHRARASRSLRVRLRVRLTGGGRPTLQVETDSYFETDYAGLTNYFKSIRAAFDDRSIRRGIIMVEGDYIACQTWIEGDLSSSSRTPRTARSNGQRVVWNLLNIFRFNAGERLVEEWVRTGCRSFLRQLGAQAR